MRLKLLNYWYPLLKRNISDCGTCKQISVGVILLCSGTPSSPFRIEFSDRCSPFWSSFVSELISSFCRFSSISNATAHNEIFTKKLKCLQIARLPIRCNRIQTHETAAIRISNKNECLNTRHHRNNFSGIGNVNCVGLWKPWLLIIIVFY